MAYTNRLFLLMLLLAITSSCTVEEKADFNAVQPLPSPNPAAEVIQPPDVDFNDFNEVVIVQMPKITDPPSRRWEDVVFEQIIPREKATGLKRLKTKPPAVSGKISAVRDREAESGSLSERIGSTGPLLGYESSVN